jgi:hypothetical protein
MIAAIAAPEGAYNLACIDAEEWPELGREAPNWMFDERRCAGMSLR